MARTLRFVVVLAAALVAGVAVAVGAALLGHEVLVAIYGEDLAPIDDTLPMLLAVGISYLAGGVAGLVVVVLGWRRFIRRPRAGTGASPR